MLTIVYQSGYHDGKQAALAKREWNFCERCGKRTADLTAIHTCTPPQREWVGLTEEDFSAINQSCLTKLQAATSAGSILMERNS
jgi:hypothetical protein